MSESEQEKDQQTSKKRMGMGQKAARAGAAGLAAATMAVGIDSKSGTIEQEAQNAMKGDEDKTVQVEPGAQTAAEDAFPGVDFHPKTTPETQAPDRPNSGSEFRVYAKGDLDGGGGSIGVADRQETGKDSK